MIKTKSVYSTINRQGDGLRVLVTRFRGRGLPKNRCDVWMPSLGPSERLLRDFQSAQSELGSIWPELSCRTVRGRHNRQAES
jgi:uncharacterized protein YeaO (DUF488 family)